MSDSGRAWQRRGDKPLRGNYLAGARLLECLERGVASETPINEMWRTVRAQLDEEQPDDADRLLAFTEGFLECVAFFDGREPSYMPRGHDELDEHAMSRRTLQAYRDKGDN
jgi:hypothetical protein